MSYPSSPSETLIVTPPRHDDESPFGYALRLADANGYGSPRIVRKLMAERVGKAVRLAPELSADRDILRELEKLADLPRSSLKASSWNRIASAAGPYFNIRGAVIPNDALMTSHAQVCPQCLDESGYLREDWELSAVTICPVHHVALIDKCPSCGKLLHVARIPVTTCSCCQADLCTIETEKVEAAEIALMQDIAALAPYRLRILNTVVVNSPESLFAIGHIFSFCTNDILSDNWKRDHFRKLTIHQRREALTHLVIAMNQGVIDGLSLHHQLLDHVAHRMPYMPAARGAEPLIRFLQSSEFLAPDALHILCYGNKAPGEDTAAALFNGRPPQFHSKNAVLEFLDCSEHVWNWLINKEYIHLPTHDLGFDADEVLEAKSRLSLFVTFDEMDRRFGVQGLTQRLVAWQVFATGTALRYPSDVIDTLSVGKFLDQLRMQSTRFVDFIGDKWTRVCDTDVGRRDLTEAYALVFARALRADISALYWRPPFGLVDLWLSPIEARRLNQACDVTK